MDLSTVQTKLNNHNYKHVEDCLLDLHLIWQNCRRYNTRYHVHTFISSGSSSVQTNWNCTKDRWSRTTCHWLGTRRREGIDRRKWNVKSGKCRSMSIITRKMRTSCLMKAKRPCKQARSVRMSPFLKGHSGNLRAETFARISFGLCNRATMMRQVSSSWCWSDDVSTVWSSTATETQR